MALIWVVSSQHITTSLVSMFPFADKGVHFVEYLVLGFLVAHAARRTWPDHALGRMVLLGALVAVGWGVLDEMHQAFVPGRDAELLDLVADSLGAGTGAALRGIMATVARRREVS
jgi:VanZ family protein